MYLTWRASAAALNSAAALCSALNLAYFLTRSLDTDERSARRLAAAVLCLISAGVLLESIVLGALVLTSAETIASERLVWARLLLVAGTVGMSLLIARRLLRGLG
ncbi:MAG: hypothetical protein IH957_05560 [Chloroflexi bacterium]|nr:hypothetical protein [Chloroflexota bacterium]